MVKPDRPAPNVFVERARKLYNPLGFQRGYNFVLWFIFGGALLGFTLARFQYLDLHGRFCPTDNSGSPPNVCYYFLNFDRYRIGILIHLAGVLPAAFLAVFQFVPAIRHKAILYHRMAGYLISLLVLVSNAGALMIADRAFGGDPSLRLFLGILALGTTVGLALAIYNIRRKQIDQHRAWMLRVWFWSGSIITLRLCFFAAPILVSMYPVPTYVGLPCAEMFSYYGGAPQPVVAAYPACADPEAWVAVRADSDGPRPENIFAALNSTFALSGIVAFLLHAIGVELYLRWTPREAERLRQVSYQRQLEAGMKNPGYAGLVSDRWRDGEPWVPKVDGVTGASGLVERKVSDNVSAESVEEMGQSGR